MSIADEIFKIFESRGDDSYFGEPVSQVEHALLAAFQAGERRGRRFTHCGRLIARRGSSPA
jgi:predicted HD phosphohydrolase